MASRRRKASDASSSNPSRKTRHRATRSNPPPPNNPYGIIFDPDIGQEARYNNLVSRRIVATKFIDDGLLILLGLHENVYNLLNGIGWGNFVQLSRPTYRRLVLEFLSSILVDVGNHMSGGRICFRLFNKGYVLSVAEFSCYFKLPEQGVRRASDQWNPAGFWRAISHEREGRAGVHRLYEPSKNKASKIYNPVFRYLQRLMANTIFGRGESAGVCRDSEVFMLHCLVHRVVVDVGYFMAIQLEKIGKSSSGDIVIGGLITILAERMGLDLTHLPVEKPVAQLSLTYCINFGLITKIDNVFWLTFFKRPIFPLPHPDLTTTERQGNWQPPDLSQRPPPLFQDPLPSPIRPHFDAGASSSSTSADWTSRFDTLEQSHQQLRESISTLRSDFDARFSKIETCLDGFGATIGSMHDLMQQMHNRHLSQGYASPPPPP